MTCVVCLRDHRALWTLVVSGETPGVDVIVTLLKMGGRNVNRPSELTFLAEKKPASKEEQDAA